MTTVDKIIEKISAGKDLTAYEQAVIEYEDEIISRCPGCWNGCPDCLSPYPVPPNLKEYEEE